MSLIKKILVIATVLGFSMTSFAIGSSAQRGTESTKSFLEKCNLVAYLFAYDQNLDELIDTSADSPDSVYGRLLGKYAINDQWSLRLGFNYSYNFNDSDTELEDPIAELRWSGKLGGYKAFSYLRAYAGFSHSAKEADRISFVRSFSGITLPTTISPDLNAFLWTRVQGFIYEKDSDSTDGSEYDLKVFPGLSYKVNDWLSASTYTQFQWSSARATSTFKRSDDIRQYAGLSFSLGKLTVETIGSVSLTESTTENTDFEVDFIYSIF